MMLPLSMIFRQCLVISSMVRCSSTPRHWNFIQLLFKVQFPWMRTKTQRLVIYSVNCILFYSIPFYSILLYILFYFFCSILFFVLFYSILFRSVLFQSILSNAKYSILFYSILFYSLFFSFLLFSSILFSSPLLSSPLLSRAWRSIHVSASSPASVVSNE